MRNSPILVGFVLACSMFSSGCTELLLDGQDYHLDEGAGGSAGAGGDSDLVCDNGFTTCDDACVRVASDAHHCGACGHDCLGAACDAGMCATQEIVTQIQDPHAFAVDDTHVYWTSGAGAVERAPKAGGAVETVASVQNDPGAIAVDGKRVYWINRGDGTLLKRKKDGKGALKVVFDGGEGGGLEDLVLDPDNLYFSRKLEQGDIRRAGKESDALPEVLVGEQPEAARIGLLGAALSWAGFIDQGGPDEAAGGYVRFMLRQGGSDFTTLASGEGQITALVSAGDTAVWVDATAGRIRARKITDSAPVTLVEATQVQGVAADETGVFWSTGTGTVSSHALGSGETRVLAYGVAAPRAIAVDSTHVYILSTGAAGGILRVAR